MKEEIRDLIEKIEPEAVYTGYEILDQIFEILEPKQMYKVEIRESEPIYRWRIKAKNRNDAMNKGLDAYNGGNLNPNIVINAERIK